MRRRAACYSGAMVRGEARSRCAARLARKRQQVPCWQCGRRVAAEVPRRAAQAIA